MACPTKPPGNNDCNRKLDEQAVKALFDRRSFTRLFVLGWAASLTPGRFWQHPLLAEVRQVGPDEAGSLTLKLSDYPPLAADLGSVRIGTSSLVDNTPTGLFFPIIVNRAPGRIYHALSSECTHASTVVRAFSKSTNTSGCPRHGSQFAIDGSVVNGPAAAPLRKYDSVFDGKDQLSIRVPDMGFAVDAQLLESPVPGKLAIEFLAFSNLEYEVSYRPGLDLPWQRATFSTAPGAAPTLSVLAGDDNFRKVYVSRTGQSGIFRVGVRTRMV